MTTAIQKEIQNAMKPMLDDLRREMVDLLSTIQPAREWVSLSEYAEIKGVTARTVNRWINDGRVEARGEARSREIRL